MERIFNITDYGAVADAKELQTAKIQAAIDACFLAGGGEVVVPAGTFRLATIRLRSHVTLHLLSGATLEGSTDPEDYTHFLEDTLQPIHVNEKEPNYGDKPLFFDVDPMDKNDGSQKKKTPSGNNPLSTPWYNAIIRAFDAEDIRIVGEKDSYIDGKNCFNPNGEEKYRGPHAINMFRCRNIEITGYTVRDSANWAHILFECQNIFAHDLTVLAGHDGIHCRTCDNIVIEDCDIYSGDDCIAGYDNQNMVIRRCLLDCACSAMRLGGTDILVDSCRTHAPSRFGFRGSLSLEDRAASAPTNETHRHTQHTPFLYFCNFPTKIRKTPGNIIIQNCLFENPKAFFRLWFDGKHPWCENKSLESITFRNCKATNLTDPMEVLCPVDEPVRLRLENVEIGAKEGYGHIDFIRALNFGEIILDHVTVTGYDKNIIRVENPGKIILRDSSDVEIVNDIL